jgi:hypothetical protein
MFKYTPKKSILEEMRVKEVGRWWDKQWAIVGDILKRHRLDNNYMLAIILRDKYPSFCFYSENQLSEVPIQDICFP